MAVEHELLDLHYAREGPLGERSLLLQYMPISERHDPGELFVGQAGAEFAAHALLDPGTSDALRFDVCHLTP